MKLFTALICGLLTGLVLTVTAERGCAQGAPQTKPRALRAEYRTTGVLPGSRPEEGARSAIQTITLDPDGSRLIYEERIEEGPKTDGSSGASRGQGRKFILRMDMTPPVIYEILEGGKSYREHKGDLNEYQADRRITEDQLIKNSRSLKKAEREALLKQNYLRADGKRVVEVTRDEGKQVLGRPTEHLVVTENGRTIIDSLVTRSVPGSRSYYHLYRRLGAFSEEVLEKLAKLEGLPLTGRVTVVTALPAAKFDFEATKIENVDLPPTAFDLPPGAVRVEDVPSEAACHVCGKTIEDPENAPVRGFEGGRVIFLCSDACWEKYQGKDKKKK